MPSKWDLIEKSLVSKISNLLNWQCQIPTKESPSLQQKLTSLYARYNGALKNKGYANGRKLEGQLFGETMRSDDYGGRKIMLSGLCSKGKRLFGLTNAQWLEAKQVGKSGSFDQEKTSGSLTLFKRSSMARRKSHRCFGLGLVKSSEEQI